MKTGASALARYAALAAILAVPTTAMSFFDGAQAPTQAASSTGDVGTKLASAIMSNIGDRSTTASSADLEGFIIYVISQGDYQPETIAAALDQVGAGATGNMKVAVDNVRLALLKKKLTRGTAAILGNNGGNGGNGAGDFATPGVSVGGGGSNYAT